MTFPSADQIALAIVTAARTYGDDPLAIGAGAKGNNRGRVLAYAALTEAFRGVTKAKVARWCGFPSQSAAASHLNMSRKAKWWNEAAIDEIVGALVADDIEPPHFGADERRLISRMRTGGADATAIAAALGASSGEVDAWLREHRL